MAFCKNCGAELQSDQTYCGACGTSVNESDQSVGAGISDSNPSIDMVREVFGFGGRLGRAGFFIRVVGIFPVGALLMILLAVLVRGGAQLTLIAFILFSVFFISACTRRLHDLDRRGWVIILIFVPIVQFVITLYLLFWPGTQGVNRYGSSPTRWKVSPP